MTAHDYSNKTIQELEQYFSTSVKNGLTDAQVITLRKKYGLHEYKKPLVSGLTIFLRQFRSPFIYLLFGAFCLSLILADFMNAAVIIGIILVNTILGFVQEFRAEKAARFLESYMVVTARVRRNGVEKHIMSKDLVPGDIVVLEPGDALPADLRFVVVDNVTVDESVLTGESIPVNKMVECVKKDSCIGYLGTVVIAGTATGIIVATGLQTSFGKISELTLQTAQDSKFRQDIIKLSSFLIKLALVIMATVFTFNLIIKGSQADIVQLLMFSLALAISITPEALPVVTTFALSHGSMVLARHKVIVKRLAAIEDLGSINVLCADKTGTITENKLTVKDAYRYHDQDPIFVGSFGTSATSAGFDAAIRDAVQKNNQQLPTYTIVKELPFDPVRRARTLLVEHNNTNVLVIKGALEEVVSRCSIAPAELTEIQKWARDNGLLGRRIIAVAQKPLSQRVDDLVAQEKEMQFVGLIAFEDPLKKSTISSLKKAQKLGIEIKILTGDSKEVAGAVAKQVGLIKSVDDVLVGTDLEKLHDGEKIAAIYKYKVFARITPQQKYDIIEILKLKSAVGFLGEGINDAPALKAAHVGIAVQEATDIAKGAADIILLKTSLSVIIDGIEIGRTVFANTVKYIKIVLALVLGNFYSVALISFFVNYLPLLPIQILLINLLSDFPMIAIGTDRVDAIELKRPSEYKIKDIAYAATLFGLISSFFDFIFFGIFHTRALATLQTNWFIENMFTQLAIVYSLRTVMPFYRAPLPSLPLIILSCTTLFVSVLLPYTEWGRRIFSFVRPQVHDIVIIIFLTLAYFIISEIVKVLYYRMGGSYSHEKKV